MICCKIIADYNNSNGNFSNLLEDFSKAGEWLWDNNVLFFSETNTDIMTEKKILNIIKRNNYTKCYVDVYNENNKPQESEYINSWLIDKLVKINYNTCEKKSQEAFQNISRGLDILDQEIQQLREQK